MFGMVYIVFWMSHLGLGWGILYSGWFKWYCGQRIWFWRTFHFWGRGIWWFRWYFWYFVWWLCDLGWLFGIWTDIFCVSICAFGMLGNIFDIWEHPCLHFGCCVLFFWWFFGFLDGTFPGPNCPGPNLPLFQGGQLGPGQLGPGQLGPDPILNFRWFFHDVWIVFVIQVVILMFGLIYIRFWIAHLGCRMVFREQNQYLVTSLFVFLNLWWFWNGIYPGPNLPLFSGRTVGPNCPGPTTFHGPRVIHLSTHPASSIKAWSPLHHLISEWILFQFRKWVSVSMAPHILHFDGQEIKEWAIQRWLLMLPSWS